MEAIKLQLVATEEVLAAAVMAVVPMEEDLEARPFTFMFILLPFHLINRLRCLLTAAVDIPAVATADLRAADIPAEATADRQVADIPAVATADRH